jgi:hypothetical protein
LGPGVQEAGGPKGDQPAYEEGKVDQRPEAPAGAGGGTAADASSGEPRPNLPSPPSSAPFALAGERSVAAAFSSQEPPTVRAGAVVVHDVSCPAYVGETAKLWP